MTSSGSGGRFNPQVPVGLTRKSKKISFADQRPASTFRAPSFYSFFFSLYILRKQHLADSAEDEHTIETVPLNPLSVGFREDSAMILFPALTHADTLEGTMPT